MPTAASVSLFGINASVAEGQTLAAVEEAVLARSIASRATASRRRSSTKVHAQLRARFVYDSDSVTDIAHQLGYFETIGSWRAYHDAARRGSTP